MSQAYLPGFWNPSSPDQSRIGNGVVRRAKGPLNHEGVITRQQPHNAMDLGRLQALLEIHVRQNRRNSPGQHGLPRAGGADHDHVMSTCRRHLQTSLDVFLALHLVEINGIAHLFRENLL